MRSFDSHNGYDGAGAMEEMVARVQDIKASPQSGKQRLVVREKGKNLTHATIDIDMKNARDLKTKETYVFQVQEKDDSRNPGFQRKRSAEYKMYECENAPEEYNSSYESQRQFGRFGGKGRLENSKRTRF